MACALADLAVKELLIVSSRAAGHRCHTVATCSAGRVLKPNVAGSS